MDFPIDIIRSIQSFLDTSTFFKSFLISKKWIETNSKVLELRRKHKMNILFWRNERDIFHNFLQMCILDKQKLENANKRIVQPSDISKGNWFILDQSFGLLNELITIFKVIYKHVYYFKLNFRKIFQQANPSVKVLKLFWTSLQKYLIYGDVIEKNYHDCIIIIELQGKYYDCLNFDYFDEIRSNVNLCIFQTGNDSESIISKYDEEEYPDWIQYHISASSQLNEVKQDWYEITNDREFRILLKRYFDTVFIPRWLIPSRTDKKKIYKLLQLKFYELCIGNQNVKEQKLLILSKFKLSHVYKKSTCSIIPEKVYDDKGYELFEIVNCKIYK